MIIVSFASTKGGVGKSTMAAIVTDSLLRKGRSVRMIDLDPQGTAQRWAENIVRTNTSLKISEPKLGREADFVDLYNELLELSENETDWVVIDTPGQDHFHQPPALAASDVVICPSGPIESELIGVQKTLKYLEHALKRIDPELDPMDHLRILYQKPIGFPDAQGLTMREVLFEHFGVIGEFHQSSAIAGFLAKAMTTTESIAALATEGKSAKPIEKIQQAADRFTQELEDQING